MVAVADGRRLRREQNREAVLDAMVSLFTEGALQPTTDEIAERAGVSARSLFRYFDDVEDLYRAAIERHLAAARPLLDLGVGPEAPLPVRVERLVDARLRMYDAVGPAARAARASAHRSPVVAGQLREARSFLRRQLRSLFAPELAGRPAVLPAVDVLCSFESYDLLRGDQRMSRASAEAALTAALMELLGP